MIPGGQVEHELKFALAAGQQLPDLSGLAEPGPVAEFDLVATYYDSPDFRLAAARQVIRRRSGGTDAGWHLKRPGRRVDERIEVHAELASNRPPQHFRELVADVLQDAPLVPVAVLRTHRSEQQLLGPGGSVLALVCTDDVEAVAGGHTQAWREAEVELVGGTAAFAAQVSKVLERSGVHRSESPSKAARAMQPAMAAAHAAESSGAVLLAYCALQVGVLQGHEAGVRSDGEDAVHRSRVATRRLRSALRTYGRLFPPGQVQQVRAELRWHAEKLGRARDTEVLLQRLLGALSELQPPAPDAVRDRVRSALSDAHAVAHARLVKSMATRRYEELQQELERFLVSPALTSVAAEPAIGVLPPLLANAGARVAELVSKAAARPDDLVGWHEVRKAAKAVRYGAEVLVGQLGEPADAYRALWEQVTEAFGEVQDCTVAAGTLGQLKEQARAEGLQPAALAELAADQERRLRAALPRGRAALAVALAAPVPGLPA